MWHKCEQGAIADSTFDMAGLVLLVVGLGIHLLRVRRGVAEEEALRVEGT
jgi:hypothetical protein